MTAADAHRRDRDRLLRRTAEAVERQAGDGLGPAGEQRCQAADRVVVAAQNPVAGDDVVDLDRVEAHPRGQRPEALGEKLLWVYLVQPSVGTTTAARGADDIDDPGVAHGQVASWKNVRGRASASSLRTIGPTSAADSTGLAVGPRCHPSAIASTSPEASITWPVTSDESAEASQVATGATQVGAKPCRTSSERLLRSPVSRVSAPGAMAVGGDAVAAELDRSDLGERGDAGLGGAVVGLAGVGVDARHRSGVDQPRVDGLAGLGTLSPVGSGMVARRECALQMHADHRVPLFLGHGEEHSVAEDSRVVDEDVQPPEGVDGLLDQVRPHRPKS